MSFNVLIPEESKCSEYSVEETIPCCEVLQAQETGKICAQTARVYLVMGWSGTRFTPSIKKKERKPERLNLVNFKGLTKAKICLRQK